MKYYNQNHEEITADVAFATMIGGNYVIVVTSTDVHRMLIGTSRHLSGMTPEQAKAWMAEKIASVPAND